MKFKEIYLESEALVEQALQVKLHVGVLTTTFWSHCKYSSVRNVLSFAIVWWEVNAISIWSVKLLIIYMQPKI